jgi:hypothetical protein
MEGGNQSGKCARFREIEREEILDSNMVCIENVM